MAAKRSRKNNGEGRVWDKGEVEREEREAEEKATRDDVRIENLVRVRVQAVLSNGGLPEAGVAKEVLYWLPQEFVEWYRQLFLESVKLDGRGRERSRGRDGKEEEENVKAGTTGVPKKQKGETAEEYQMRVTGRPDGGVMGVGKGGGKKYKVAWTIKDEEALQVKGEVDKFLQKLAIAGNYRSLTSGVGNRLMGVVKDRGDRAIGVIEGGRCRDCGKTMRHDWVRCPFHALRD